MKFNTNYLSAGYEDPSVVYEVSVTEQTGWLPVSKQVERLIRAGENLMAWRKESFDFQHGEKDDGRPADPTKSPDFDLADASRILEDFQERVNEAAAADAVGSRETAPGSDDDSAADAEGGESAAEAD